ncbi:glycerophosphoryl diester phosphodiesterase [Neptunitalea chrysea]|uniref:Glycerophosphoryl diester phosphodiesterase n=1 Tax=Neptunitalea chrysea TaxID=1647581 RepID=A0A9W6B7V6_9FLAO|nr:glycerophosphodiester phosphodiesterase family protein [Neptunitalea chrysea]GLB52977.1 glycerophosphoryl diester phosphodiesterase [Neptunitalea chrysea]
MKKYGSVLFALWVFLLTACTHINTVQAQEIPADSTNTIAYLRNVLLDENSNQVMVIAHRGDWRNAPENSIMAIENCIAMGVDMVEIDVRKTKDGKLVLMHDSTVDRTTNGKGKVSSLTLNSLKKLHLKNGQGRVTHHTIPTLEEALQAAKGKILVNLDKCYGYFDEVYAVMEKTGTVNQVVLKAYNKPYSEVRKDIGDKLDKILFMPIVNLDKQADAWQIITDYQKAKTPVAFEIVFATENSDILNRFKQIQQGGSRVWVNSLWASLNAGYEDDMAVNNPDGIYGWLLKKGVTMLQTDRPQLLLAYLRKKQLHR